MTTYTTRNRTGVAVSLHLANGGAALLWIAAVVAAMIVVNLGIAVAGDGDVRNTGTVMAFLAIFGFIGMAISMTQMQALALSLGLSRRTFYLASSGVYVTGAAVLTALVMGLAAIERATLGWGVGMWLFDGTADLPMAPAAAWATFLALVVAGIFLGALCGAVYARWGIRGMWVTAIAGIVLAGAVVIAARRPGAGSMWGRVHDSLGLEVVAIGGILLVAALAGVLAYLILRRTPY